MTAQALFNAIQSGSPEGQALRAKVNRAAAEAEGYVEFEVVARRLIGRRANKLSSHEIADYTASLADAARLKLPDGCDFRVCYYSERGSVQLVKAHGDTYIVDYDGGYADEACARTCCWFVAQEANRMTDTEAES